MIFSVTDFPTLELIKLGFDEDDLTVKYSFIGYDKNSQAWSMISTSIGLFIKYQGNEYFGEKYLQLSNGKINVGYFFLPHCFFYNVVNWKHFIEQTYTDEIFDDFTQKFQFRVDCQDIFLNGEYL